MIIIRKLTENSFKKRPVNQAFTLVNQAFTLTVFGILAFEGKSVLLPAQLGPGSGRVNELNKRNTLVYYAKENVNYPKLVRITVMTCSKLVK